MTLLDGLFIIALVSLETLFLDFIHQRNAKKCGYNCSDCKNWDCMAFYCAKKKENKY